MRRLDPRCPEVRPRHLPACLALALLVPLLASCADREAPAEILWDEWGVPHIYAESTEGLGHAFGWAQMRLHGDAILQLYGLARGRGAEYWGEGHLASDRLLHRLGLPEGAEAALGAQRPELRRYLEAFAEGMNAYAEAHPEALADSVERVLPVEPADPLRHGQRQMFAFVSLIGSQPSVIGLDGMPTRAYEREAQGSRAAASSGAAAGSNTWAIGPSRSASGNAMLLLNPHLPWRMPFMRWTEAKLAGPEGTHYGSTLIGVPVMILGFNEALGWSHTVNTVDALDAYRLRLEGDGYRFDGEVRAFEEERRVLRVRTPDGGTRPDTVLLRRSVHGPVAWTGDSTAVALRSPVVDRWGALGQWWEMARAGSLSEFEDVLRPLRIPFLTVAYADREGRVFYLSNGQVPERPSGDFARWQRTLPGDTPATLWEGILDYGDLPRVVDPESGFVQNSNSPPWLAAGPGEALEPDSFPPYLSPPGPLNLREQRGLEMLVADDTVSFDELVEMRYSNRLLMADRVLDDLLLAARASEDEVVRRAADVLEAWDRSANRESRGAVLFREWALRFCAGQGGGTAGGSCGWETPWSPSEPLATPDGLADPGAAAERLGRAARAVAGRHGSLDVAWGEVMRLSDDLPGNGATGQLGAFHVVEFGATNEEGSRFRPVHGDSWVAAVEFTPEGPRGELLLAYGNASQPGSPHDGDQLELLFSREMRPLWWSRDSVEAHLERRETPGRP